MKDLLIKDIVVSKEFVKDYEEAPKTVKKRVDVLMKMMDDHGSFPNSVRPHYSRGEGGFWIGYVTQRRGAWRFLFEEKDGVLYFNRLLTHVEMDDYFKSCGV